MKRESLGSLPNILSLFQLLGLLAPEEPELPVLVDLPDYLLVLVLQLPEAILLADGLPGLLKQSDELVFDLGDVVDEVPLPRHSFVELIGDSFELYS